ncbi:hypothetical protein [Flavobacterium psychrotrophum]|uniref:hypothetical protein n=1 Tax=Flavobacterium psychrotrophum TaxID=2294119 RepID=UPI000E30C617|nr:hypothetical protein [Flavobacterium psychrotrophum]
MKYLRFLLCLGFAALLFSCNDDEKARIAETQRTIKTNDSILKVIAANWKFDLAPPTPKVAESINGWNEWQQFLNELHQKPTGTLDAYRRKTKILVTKADQLMNNIPPFFNKPQIRSRLAVLVTQTRQLYTFMSIETIPDKKVVGIINAITDDLDSTQKQFDEIIRFSEIPKEEGEEQMLRALDTTRLANPDAVMPQTQPNLATPQNKYQSGGHGAGYIKQTH